MSSLDLNRCREAAWPIPFAASCLRSFRLIILSLASLEASLKSCLNFLYSPLNEGDGFDVFRADREGILPRRIHLSQASRDVRNQTKRVVRRPGALVHDPSFLPHIMSLVLPNTHTSWQRDRLITRYLHWINRMSSEQGGQQHAFVSPSRVTPQSFGDCRGQRGTSQLPCIFSSSNSTSILRQACRNYQCSHCSEVKTHLIAPILFIVVVALAALSFCTSRFVCFLGTVGIPPVSRS